MDTKNCMIEEWINDRDFMKREWLMETTRYSIRMNGNGQYWPIMEVKTSGGGWYQIIIRDRNPFKSLNRAIAFTEKTIARTSNV